MAFWSQGDAYGIQEDDEDSSDVSSSSEDEIDIILHGTPDQKRKLKHLHDRLDERNRGNDKSSSSEDEFEKEMNAELAQQVDFMERNRGATERLSIASGSVQKKVSDSESHKELFYDDVYFDSDEEGNKAGVSQESSKHAIISNDDLLYDPTMDDKDQRWVDKQRRRHNNITLQQKGGTSASGKRQKSTKLPSSDALLDCPACMTTLCLDCQRHDTYKNQYRAMFVMNCRVDTSRMLECPTQQTKHKKKKKTLENNDTAAPDGGSNSDLFHPVNCTECSTVVGVIDSDDVYHFFNVLASYT